MKRSVLMNVINIFIEIAMTSETSSSSTGSLSYIYAFFK